MSSQSEATRRGFTIKSLREGNNTARRMFTPDEAIRFLMKFERISEAEARAAVVGNVNNAFLYPNSKTALEMPSKYPAWAALRGGSSTSGGRNLDAEIEEFFSSKPAVK